jgi:hypothetical protein
MSSHKPSWVAELNGSGLIFVLVFALTGGLILWRTTPSKTTRLIVAAQTGHADVVEKLLVSGVNPNAVIGTNCALIAAIRNRKLAVLNTLLSHGANANFDAGTGVTPLAWAVKVGDLELVKALIQSGADPNQRSADGKTAADEAQHSPEILRLLMKGSVLEK